MIDIDNYLRINIVDMVMVLISTFLIVVIARKYFWNALKDYLTKRQEYIEGQLKEAQDRNVESQNLFQKTREDLAKAKLQAGEILQTAQAQASWEAGTIVEDAKEKAKGLLDKARLDISREKLEAAEEIKEQMGAIAIAAARQIVEKEVDEKVHRHYVEEFIEEAGEKLWDA